MVWQGSANLGKVFHFLERLLNAYNWRFESSVQCLRFRIILLNK
jgi:hypothetical protein